MTWFEPELSIGPKPWRLREIPTPIRPLLGLDPSGQTWLWDEGAVGGNKIRKLEWLLGRAKERDKTEVLLLGPLGSNWVLSALRAAESAAFLGHVVLFDAPTPPYAIRNQKEIEARAATLYRARTPVGGFLKTLRLRLGQPQIDLLPPGGSSVWGCLGHVEAVLELAQRVARGDLPEPEVIFVAAGTGGTVAGLAAGLELTELRTRLHAVRVTSRWLINPASIHRLAKKVIRLLQANGLRPGRLHLDSTAYGEGYAQPTRAALRAVNLAAEHENLPLETTYTGKALAALLAQPGPEAPRLFFNSYRKPPNP